MIPTLINLHPNEHSQELHYYPFAATLDRCVGSCNTLNDLSNKVCVPNKSVSTYYRYKSVKNINKAYIMQM